MTHEACVDSGMGGGAAPWSPVYFSHPMIDVVADRQSVPVGDTDEDRGLGVRNQAMRAARMFDNISL